jgi:class 3 adenylate cyclase
MSSPAADSLHLLLVDPDEDTAGALRGYFADHGRAPPRWEPDLAKVDDAVRDGGFDALIFDFHADRSGDLEVCARLKGLHPALPVVALCAPGPALRRLKAWIGAHGAIDEIVAKPLAGNLLFESLALLVGHRRAATRADRMATLVSEEGRSWVDSDRKTPVISEMAILFTDIRRSTALASALPAPELFDAVNRSLSSQAAIVRRWQGSVVKFTGDGLLADFRGRGRSHLALRCAMALQEEYGGDRAFEGLPIGVGAAEGLVMTGLIGEPGLQQFDVLGATVHLAARLCSLAHEGEIVVTPKLVRAAALPLPGARKQIVNLRGFDKPIESVSFVPGGQRESAA